MTTSTPRDARGEEDDDYYNYPDDPDDEDGDCFWCAGEGVSECSDPIECCNRHDKWGNCRCASCGGTGRAKDMTIW